MEGPPETDDTRKRDGDEAVQQTGDAAGGVTAAQESMVALLAAGIEPQEAPPAAGPSETSTDFVQPLQVQPASVAPNADAGSSLAEAAQPTGAIAVDPSADAAALATADALGAVHLSEMDRSTLEQLAALAAAATDSGLTPSFGTGFTVDTPQPIVTAGIPGVSSSVSASPAVPTPTPPFTRAPTYGSANAPVPATPRASDPPIPIDHALTEPIAAFYKLQFYPDHGVDGPSMAMDSGGEEDGFAYYMQTLDVTIGRKVIPPAATVKSPVKSPQNVPFDSFISIQDHEQDVKPRVSPTDEHAEHINAEAGPSSAGGKAAEGSAGAAPAKAEKEVDVDLGALKSVSRLHARIGYSYTLSQFYLEVLGRNGAWIDDVFAVKGSRVALGPRTKIQISTRTFYFVLPPSSIPTYPIPYSSAYAASHNMYNNASPIPSPPGGAALLAAQQASLLPLDGQQKPAAFNAFSNREEWENERMSLFGIGAGMGENGEYGYKRRRRRRHGHRRRQREQAEAREGSDYLSSSDGSEHQHHAGLSGSESCSSCAGSEYWSSASASDREDRSDGGSASEASSSSLSEVSSSSSSLTSEDEDDDEEASGGEYRKPGAHPAEKPRARDKNRTLAEHGQDKGKSKAEDSTTRKIIKLKVKLPIKPKEDPSPESSKAAEAVPIEAPAAVQDSRPAVAGKHPNKGVKAVKAIKSEESPPSESKNDALAASTPKVNAGPTAEEKAALAKAARDAKQAAKKAAAEQRRLEKEAAREAARLEKARLKQEALDAKLAKKAQMEAAAAAALASAVRPPPQPVSSAKPQAIASASSVPTVAKADTPKATPTPAALAGPSTAPPRPSQPLQTPRPLAPAPAVPATQSAPQVPTLQAQQPAVPPKAALPAANGSAAAAIKPADESAVKVESSDKYDGLPPALAAAIARLPPDAPVPTTSTKTLQAALQSGKTAPMEVDPIPLLSGNIPVSVPIPPTGQPRPPPGPILGLDGQPFIGPEPIKPSLTYAAIIHRALSNVDRGRGTLGQVCDWVAGEWEWFRLNPEAGWQNSIRHNLSLNKAFLKVPRIDSDDPESKGSVWILDPIHAPEFEAKERKAQELKDAKQRRDGERYGPSKPSTEKPRKPYKKQEPSAKAKADLSKPAGFGLNLKIPPIPPHKNFPIVVAPIPTNLKESVVNPNPNLLDGPPLVVHDGTIILNPSIFSHLTADHLAHLQSLGTQQTLQILQAYIVQYLKDKMRAQQAAKANAVRPAAMNAAAGPVRPAATAAISTATGAGPSPRPAPSPAVRPGVPVPARPPGPASAAIPVTAAAPSTAATGTFVRPSPGPTVARPPNGAIPVQAPVQVQPRPPAQATAANGTGGAIRPGGPAAGVPAARPPGPAVSQPSARPAAVPSAGPGRPPVRASTAAPGVRPAPVRPGVPARPGPGRPPGPTVRPGGPAAARPVRPAGAAPGPSAPGRPRPPGAPAGGKPPLPAETLKILAQLAAASGASSGKGGGPIAPGAAALLQYLTRVGQAADMSIATKILATGVIPPDAYPEGTPAAGPAKVAPVARPPGARPAASPIVRPKAGPSVRPGPPAAAVAKAGLGGSTPVTVSPTPSPRPSAAVSKPVNGGLTPLPGSNGGLSPLPGGSAPKASVSPAPSSTVLGKRPPEDAAGSPAENQEMKKQKVA